MAWDSAHLTFLSSLMFKWRLTYPTYQYPPVAQRQWSWIWTLFTATHNPTSPLHMSSDKRYLFDIKFGRLSILPKKSQLNILSDESLRLVVSCADVKTLRTGFFWGKAHWNTACAPWYTSLARNAQWIGNLSVIQLSSFWTYSPQTSPYAFCARPCASSKS